MSNKRLIDGTKLLHDMVEGIYPVRIVADRIRSGKYDIPNQGEAARQAFPRQPNNEGGWTISVNFLQTIADVIEAQQEHYDFGGLEGIHDVLLALEALSSHTEGTGCKECGGKGYYPAEIGDVGYSGPGSHHMCLCNPEVEKLAGIQKVRDMYAEWVGERKTPFDPQFPNYQTIVEARIRQIEEIADAIGITIPGITDGGERT